MNYTEQEWIDLMRSDPKNAGYMLLFADWLTENGRELEGEAMRLLGETGRVGKNNMPLSFQNGYFAAIDKESRRENHSVPAEWFYRWQFEVKPNTGLSKYETVGMRLALAKVYAEQATPEDREDWQRELRGLEVAT